MKTQQALFSCPFIFSLTTSLRGNLTHNTFLALYLLHGLISLLHTLAPISQVTFAVKYNKKYHLNHLDYQNPIFMGYKLLWLGLWVFLLRLHVLDGKNIEYV